MTERDQAIERYPGFPELNDLEPHQFPKHIFIVMDGNRHYGQDHFGEKLAGHPEGAKTALNIMRSALPLPGEVLTFWGFSSDNWNREKKEVDQLMSLIGNTILENSDELIEKNVRFIHLGRKDRLPKSLGENMTELEHITKNNKGKILCAAIDYGGADQELRMHTKTAEEAVRLARENPDKTPQEISIFVNQYYIERNRDGNGLIPPADLIIRPQHTRTSDVGWINGPATELYFNPDLQFPDMKSKNLAEGILLYANDKQNMGA